MTLMDLETQKVAATFKPRQTNASFYTALSASAFDSVRPRRLSHVQVYSVAIHPTYPLVAAGTRYGNVHLFDVRDPRLVVSYHAHSDSVDAGQLPPLVQLRPDQRLRRLLPALVRARPRAFAPVQRAGERRG